MFWLNRIGPINGISASPGNGTRVNMMGLLSPWMCCRNFCEIKAVIPAEKMLMTVPEIVWFTLYLIDKTPKIRANKIEEAIPPNSPNQGLFVTLPTIAAAMDAISIIPSIEMLIMPDRSARMPEKAPNVIGTASRTALESIPARFSCFPAACQTRKPKIRHSAQIPTIRLVHLPNPFTNWYTPMTNDTTARIVREIFEGRIQSAIKP